MSVIYDALKKPEKPVDGKKGVVPSPGNVLLFEDMVRKNVLPLFFLLFVIVVAVVGGLYYLYQYDVVPSGSSPVLPEIPRVKDEPAAEFPDKTSELNSVAAPVLEEPDGIEEKAITVAHIKADEIPEELAAIPEEITVERTGQQMAQPESSAEKPELTTGRAIVNQQQTQLEKTVGIKPQEVKPVPSIDSTQKQRSDAVVESVAKRMQVQPVVQAESRSKRSRQEAITEPRLAYGSSSQIDSETKKTASAVATPAQIQQSVSANEITDFNPEIQKLNIQLQKSIQQRNFAQGTEVIKELENLLGEESPYVLKLKSYFYLQNNDVSRAHQFLAQVLKKNATDLEAGLNMIVVLVRQGKLNVARERVNALLNYYPDNQTLLHYKQQIGN